MELKFEKLEYQEEAVNSACDLFKGQDIRKSEFTIIEDYDTQDRQISYLGQEIHTGYANKININKKLLLDNLRRVQIKNGIAPSETVYGNNSEFPQFNIEMETGTGKTFVYLKTILSLNEKYGFSKFVIVVPSLAIKAGTIKNLEITEDYFKSIFKGVTYDYFEYDSDNLNRVMQFSRTPNIDIMVINIQSFNSEAGQLRDNKGLTNIIYRESEKIGGNRPIDLIRSTNPIIIIDEPQSVDNTELSKKAINNLNPSVGLRYSATHRDKSYPLIYKLGPVEAYEKELVKEIEVSGITSDDDPNEAYLKLVSVDNKKNISAKVELYKKSRSKISKKTIKLRQGDSLLTKTKLPVYKKVGYVIDIDTTPGQEAIYFSGEPSYITLRQQERDDLDLKRIQIRETIVAHLEKQLKLKPLGVKVLSLFFIDRVDKYRVYDGEGNPHPGIYAKIFEEEFEKLIKLPKYREIYNADINSKNVHDGYFSVDRKGRIKNTRGESKADATTYDIIMKDKEGLLTFYNPEKGNTSRANQISFIFSHSALKEGWDNPNVFQIATLIDTKDNLTKRQKIGRGLRIAVNQSGKRVRGFDVNTLTVMANESYENFAKGLQSEYEEAGIKFGEFDDDVFATIVTKYDPVTEEIQVLGKQKSANLVSEMKENNYINSRKHATNKLINAISEGHLDVSEEFKDYVPEILKISASKLKTVKPKNAKKRKEIEINKKALSSKEFNELWDKIKYRTDYKVNIDTETLVHYCITGSDIFPDGVSNIATGNRTYQVGSAKLKTTEAGIDTKKESVKVKSGYLKDKEYDLPDIITELQNTTQLTRRTIVEILLKSGNLDEFKNNPTSYMMQASNIINIHKNNMIIDNITYDLNGEEFDLSIFNTDLETTYDDINSTDYKVTINPNKTVKNYIKTDSKVEQKFAEELDRSENVKFYFKLPNGFKIKTPMGTYNPDWALIMSIEGRNELYFVAETKGSTSATTLRTDELNNIRAGREHFKALNTNINYKVAEKLDDLIHNN